MSVFKRNGVGKYYIQFNYNGKTYCRSSKTTNKRTAERMEREWKDEIHLIEELGERPRIKLRDAFTQYLDQKLGTKGHQYVQTNVNTVNERFNVDMYVDEIRNWHLSNLKVHVKRKGQRHKQLNIIFKLFVVRLHGPKIMVISLSKLISLN